METIDNNNMVHRFQENGREIILIGTAHVSRESVELVANVIRAENPDTVSVELCESRYHTIQQKALWQEMDIIKVIKEKKAFLLFSNLLMASFQKRLAQKFDTQPGQEMLTAIETGTSSGAAIHLADREIRITLSRAWRVMSFWAKNKLLFQLLLSATNIDDISEAEIEKMKQEDVLQSILSEVEKTHPVLREILIDERDRYLAGKIRTAPGKKIVAVVGAGHVPGIKRYWNHDIDLQALETLPPPSRLATILKWAIPLMIIAFIGVGFFFGGKKAGADMIKWWFLATGSLSGLGAVIALSHPLTILSAIVAAPFTAIHPMIAAGWVSGLVEAFLRKPKVRDFENLTEDILSVKGFWKNSITRILLVVVLTNLGTTAGTLIAFPLMIKIFVGGG